MMLVRFLDSEELVLAVDSTVIIEAHMNLLVFGNFVDVNKMNRFSHIWYPCTSASVKGIDNGRDIILGVGILT